MLADNLDLYCPVVAGALPHIRAKSIKFFGVITDQRSPLLPELPTLAEQGLPGINGNYWLGIFAPAGTPEPIAAKLTRRPWRLSSRLPSRRGCATSALRSSLPSAVRPHI